MDLKSLKLADSENFGKTGEKEKTNTRSGCFDILTAGGGEGAVGGDRLRKWNAAQESLSEGEESQEEGELGGGWGEVM